MQTIQTVSKALERAHTALAVERSFLDNEALSQEAANKVLHRIPVSLKGRIQTQRKMGKIYFAHLLDSSHEQMQILCKSDATEGYEALKLLIGDLVEVQGVLCQTKTGEISVLVQKLSIARRSMHPFPDKFKGLGDDRGRRWLSAMTQPLQTGPQTGSQSPRNVVLERARLMSCLRSFMGSQGFLEVETPILSEVASGAQARAFQTHHNDQDQDLTLRIAPELFLKMYVGSGFDRVYEIGKVFRNEGSSASHLQEFTSIEWYSAWDSYRENLHRFRDFIESYIPHKDLYVEGEFVRYNIQYQGRYLNFTNAPVVSYRDLFITKSKALGLERDPFEMDAKEADLFFKQNIRPSIIQPLYVIDYPSHMCPLAQRSSQDSRVAEQWQLIVEGMEIVKCYTELTDPVLQRSLLEEQLQRKNGGDEEAVAMDENFLLCMEFGMPPMSGLGMGLDRVLSLVCDVPHIRDVVFF